MNCTYSQFEFISFARHIEAWPHTKSNNEMKIWNECKRCHLMHGVDDIEFKAKKSLITLRIVYALRILVDYIIIEKKKNENPNRVYAFAHKDGSVQWIVYVAVNQFGTISQSKLQYEKWRTLRIWLYTQELHWFLLLSSVATEMRFVAVLSISRTESIDIAVSCHLWPPSISILVAFGICTPRNRSTKNVTVNSLPA